MLLVFYSLRLNGASFKSPPPVLTYDNSSNNPSIRQALAVDYTFGLLENKDGEKFSQSPKSSMVLYHLPHKMTNLRIDWFIK